MIETDNIIVSAEKNDSMLVSIIIPTYNRANMITRAIESILQQSYSNFEIIVVDDGSTDNTLEIIEEFKQNTSGLNLWYFKKENGGCASARNKGIDMATGDLIAFLDSDDLWVPQALESLVSALINTGADFVYSPAIEAYPDGRESINYPVARGHPEIFAAEHFKNTNVRNGALLFRKSVFSKSGKFDEDLKYNEDSDFFQRVAICCKAAYSDIPTVKHFHHKTNKSGNRVEIYKALLRSAKKILAKNREFAESLGETADKRVLEIKLRLIEYCILTGNLGQASDVASDIKDSLSMPIKMALMLKSKLPIKAKQIAEKIIRLILL